MSFDSEFFDRQNTSTLEWYDGPGSTLALSVVKL